jgi:hypothetical protein
MWRALVVVATVGACGARDRPPPPPVPAPTPRAAPPAPTPWQRRCMAELASGREAAARHEPALAEALVDHAVLGDGGARASMVAMPPYQGVAPVYVHVDRGGAPRTPQGWAIVDVDTRGVDRYFVTWQRVAGDIVASVAIEGWPPRDAELLAPTLMAVADRCFEPPARPIHGTDQQASIASASAAAVMHANRSSLHSSTHAAPIPSRSSASNEIVSR